MRMAESVLLTCWPPAPEARKVSMRRSAGLMSMLSISSGFGQHGHGAGGGVDAALGLGFRNALHAMRRRLSNLNAEIDAPADHAKMISLKPPCSP